MSEPILTMSEAGLARLAAFCVERLALASPPADANAWLAAGQGLHAMGEREAALAAFERGVVLAPQSVDGWMAVATLRSELGRPVSALAACNQALRLAPEHPTVLLNTGLLLRFIGDLEAAHFTIEKAIRFGAPAGAAGLARARVMAAMQLLDAAADAFADCLALMPDDPEAAFGLADVELARANFGRAAELLDGLLQRFPQWTGARISLAVASVGLGDEARANALLAKAKSDDPAGCAAYRPFFSADQLGGRAVLEVPRFRVAMEITALFRCQWGNRKAFEAWLADSLVSPGDGSAIDDADIPFVALGLDIGLQARLELARNVARRIAAGQQPLRRRARRSGERIRLGYLSGDMREHPIGRLLSPVFGLHDRGHFEVYVYHTGPKEDCIPRRRAESGADVFRDVAHLPAAAVAEMVAADGIDILIDLSGYTMFNRSAALAMRPAPIQVAYLGYLGTMGAGFVDYTFADHQVLLPAVRPFWSERIAYLPDTFFCCDDGLEPLSGSVERVDLGLPAEGFVFACPNATWKIEPGIFDVWMRILRRVPNSLLWLFDGGAEHTRIALQSEAAARGVSPERLVFAGREKYSAYLLRYRLVGLVLDTTFYTGNTTTVEALAMGVPVLTCAGTELHSRVAAGLLLAHGLPELVAQSHLDYETMACALATDPVRLASLKEKVKVRRADSRLFCTERRVREFERAYEMMWERHQAGLPPADFDVPPLD